MNLPKNATKRVLLMLLAIAPPGLLSAGDPADPENPKPRAMLLLPRKPFEVTYVGVDLKRDVREPNSVLGRLLQKPAFANPRLTRLSLADSQRLETTPKGDRLLRLGNASITTLSEQKEWVDGLGAMRLKETIVSFSGYGLTFEGQFDSQNCRVWEAPARLQRDTVSRAVTFEKPERFQIGVVIWAKNQISGYLAEKGTVADKRRGLVRLSGVVVSFGFDHMTLVELVETELPDACVLLEYDEQGTLVAFAPATRAEATGRLENARP